jgi:DHA2 family multidrug resistance protein
MSATEVVPSQQRKLITLAVMAAALMQVLDTTIVNVALPHMQGSLSATTDQISWVLTSYLVASAIFMPLTGYFTDTLGRKKYLLISIAGFVVTSVLCGAAENITQIVVFRFLQGAFGAALVPLSQAIMTDIYPEEERGTAMAIWGMGIMVGPILGPTLGGYLTEMFSWRWNFYINVPVGIACMLLTWQVLPATASKVRKMDWLGLILISTCIGAAQYFLDQGNRADWFNSTAISIAALLAVLSLLGFLLHCIGKSADETIFDLKIFTDRNFTIASILLAMFGLGLYGAMVILPIMLENLFHYPVLTTGLIMAPRGISGLISMIVVGKLIKFIDPRWLIIGGIIFSAVGMAFGTVYNLNLSYGWIIGPIILQGFGLGMIFVPLSAVAFSTLPASMRAEAAGLFSLLRTIGSSIGISIVAMLLVRHTQQSWNQMGGHINIYNPAVQRFLASMHLTAQSRLGSTILGYTLGRQVQMKAFVNIFAFITWSIVIMLPLVLLLKKNKRPVSAVVME